MARAASRLLLASALASLACSGRQRVAAPAPPCADVSVVGDEVRCGGKPWARVVRAACAAADRFPGNAYLWPDELACRGLAVVYADGTRGWVFKAPALDPAALDGYTPRSHEEEASEWVADASLSPDGTRLTFRRGGVGGVTAYEFLLASRQTQKVEGTIPDPRPTAYATEGTKPRMERNGCVQAGLSRRASALQNLVVVRSMTVKFAVGADGTPARYEVMPAAASRSALATAVWEAILSCRWIPGLDASGAARSTWVILPLRFG